MNEIEIELIKNMCYTYNHEFGLLKKIEQDHIELIMKQLYQNEIKRYVEKYFIKK